MRGFAFVRVATAGCAFWGMGGCVVLCDGDGRG